EKEKCGRRNKKYDVVEVEHSTNKFGKMRSHRNLLHEDLNLSGFNQSGKRFGCECHEGQQRETDEYGNDLVSCASAEKQPDRRVQGAQQHYFDIVAKQQSDIDRTE